MLKQIETVWRSPVEAFAPIASRPGAVLLHGGDAASDARWSCIAAIPVRRIESERGETRIDGARVNGAPFDALADLHAERRTSASLDCGALLASGIIGFAGYECGGIVEPSAAGPPTPYQLPDFSFAAYDAVAAFDRSTRRAYLLGRSAAAIDELGDLLRNECSPAPETANEFSSLRSNFTRETYIDAVTAVIERIRAGDLFQANISQRLRAHAKETIDAFALFKAASVESAASYGAFLQYGAAQILSLSPERFFAVRPRDDGGFRVFAEPIKGTRPRCDDPAQDARALEALIRDPKERAENIMIADLTRNDLSRLCADHSVVEEAICEPVSYATVHHLVSRISGVLRKELSAADAFGVLFPCGSVTGAPKIEAMRVIAEAERSGRGPYCGAIGYFDDRGGADLSVAIRMAVVEQEKISIPVGGGVTLRSDPQTEYEETLAKAQHLLRHIGLNAAQ